MGKEDQVTAKQKRNLKAKKDVCSIHRKENLTHITHTLAQREMSVGVSERPGLETDMRLPNKAANLGDAVSVCWTQQQATSGASMGG